MAIIMVRRNLYFANTKTLKLIIEIDIIIVLNHAAVVRICWRTKLRILKVSIRFKLRIAN
jgi:hypothetical protein